MEQIVRQLLTECRVIYGTKELASVLHGIHPNICSDTTEKIAFGYVHRAFSKYSQDEKDRILMNGLTEYKDRIRREAGKEPTTAS